jgi:hypothetical protein
VFRKEKKGYIEKKGKPKKRKRESSQREAEKREAKNGRNRKKERILNFIAIQEQAKEKSD